MLPPFDFVESRSISEAIALLEMGGNLMAGGCTLLADLRDGRTSATRLVSIEQIPELDGFSAHPRNGLKVGAKVRASKLLPDIWTGKRFAAVHEAIEQFDTPYIANMGTVVGNVCAARADYDLPVALIAMKGEIVIAGRDRTRRLPLEEFYLGSGKTVLTVAEIAHSIECPGPGTDGGSAFKKMHLVRRRVDGPVRLSAAATITYGSERETILDATVVLGGLLMPRRFKSAEAKLRGRTADPLLFLAAAEEVVSEIGGSLSMDSTARQQAKTLLRDCIAQANARALARQDHFDDANDIAQESF